MYKGALNFFFNLVYYLVFEVAILKKSFCFKMHDCSYKEKNPCLPAPANVHFSATIFFFFFAAATLKNAGSTASDSLVTQR